MKPRIHSLTSKGFTLIELLLYVAIVSTLLMATVGFYSMATASRVKNQSIVEVNSQGTAVMELISQTIRNASGITAPATGASGSSLALTVPTAALSPTVFSLSGTTLQMTEGSGTAVALTNNKVQATNLTIKNLTRSSTAINIQVTITLSRVNPSNVNEYDYQKTFTTSGEVQW